MNGSPASIFIGNQSSTIGNVVDSLANRCELRDLPSLHISKGFGRTGQTKEKLTVSSCAHRLYESNYCETCHANQKAIYQATRRLMEERDWNPVWNLTYDFSDPFSIWSYERIVGIVSQECPKSAIGTVMIKSPFQASGLDSYLSVCSASMTLAASTYAMLRGTEEYHKDGSSYSVTDLCKMVACDLCFTHFPHNGLFYEDGSYCNFPFHICSSSNRLIDIRTSLYRSLAKIDTKKKKGIHNVEIHPLRLLSSNLHECHLKYTTQYPGLLEYFPQRHIISSYSSIKADKSRKEMEFFRPIYQEIDVQNAVNWATGGKWDWELLEDYLSARSILTKKKPAEQKESSAAQISGDFASKPLDISVLVLKSVYAEYDLLHLCEQAKLMISCHSYKHHLQDTRYSEEFILDSILSIENYFRNH